MNIKRWIGRREKNWQRLENLLNQVEKKGLKSLQAAEVIELAGLYRSVSADLARARTNKVGKTLIQSLQKLTSRSYNQIYQGSRRQEWQKAIEFCLWGFPAVVQRTWVYIGIATGLFVISGLIAWWYSWQDPSFIALVVPQGIISQVRDRQELWMGSILGTEPLASSGIMINNLKVSFNVVAGGITAGILTVYILIYNGLLIGSVGTLVGQHNLAYPFWAFVWPHGALELPAIFFAGAAGLLIARALLFPGQYRRLDALKIYGSQAAQLVFGVVVMLIIAGIIEGFFSPNPLFPDSFKYLVGIGILTALVMYCIRKKDTIASR
ncbi:MAG: stage II sporulation protein M [Spirulinaceae cyanobacterium]